MSKTIRNTRKHIRRKNRRLSGNRKIMLIASIMITLGICLSMSIVGSAKQDHELNEYYNSVLIQPGDTLTDIAKEYYVEESGDFNSYLEEIRALNKIDGDNIHAGNYITIKYYKSA